MEGKLKKDKGITLIALVITIIILLILAGISIASLTGSGLFEKVNEVKEISQKAQMKEELQLELNAIRIDEYNKNKKYTNEEVVSILEEKGYIEISVSEDEIIVGKDEYEFVIEDLNVQEINKIVIESAPDVLENPVFNYDKETKVETIKMQIQYPNYAKIKEYKIGENGSWQRYKNIVIIEENTIIYARYTTSDNRESEEVNEVITNIQENILKYTNSEKYLRGETNEDKIQRVKNLFDKSAIKNVVGGGNAIYFTVWCTEPVYFQNNLNTPLEASKVTIASSGWSNGCEPIEGFYITASNDIEFSNEVRLYEGQHIVTIKDHKQIESKEYKFEPKGSYKYYRLYVTSWHPTNGGEGQNILGCYIE